MFWRIGGLGVWRVRDRCVCMGGAKGDTYGWADEWMDGLMDGRMAGWQDNIFLEWGFR